MHITKEQKGIPVFVTENGVADKSDKCRAQFIISHLYQIRLAIDRGSNIIGYLSSKSVAITYDNSKIVSGSYDGIIKVWDLNTGKLLNTLKGHSDMVGSLAVTPDNNEIVSASSDSTIRVWDVNTGKCYSRYEFDTPIISITLSKTRNLITIGDINGNLYVGTLEGMSQESNFLT